MAGDSIVTGDAQSYFRCEVPPGRSGDWRVRRLELRGEMPADPDVSPLDAEPPGPYTALERGDVIFMTDLRNEWWTQRVAIDEACERGGAVLVTGLGLGLVAEGMLRTPGSKVEHVTVIEASADVVQLVGPHLQERLADRLDIVCADAFEWQPPPGNRYTVGWHDIWPNPQAPEAMRETALLEKRFEPLCDWQGSWAREYLATLERTAATAVCTERA